MVPIEEGYEENHDAFILGDCSDGCTYTRIIKFSFDSLKEETLVNDLAFTFCRMVKVKSRLLSSISSRKYSLFLDQIYFLGGRRGDEILNTLKCLDIPTLEWSDLPPMSENCEDLAVCVRDGYIIACGVYSHTGFLKSGEHFNMEAKT